MQLHLLDLRSLPEVAYCAPLDVPHDVSVGGGDGATPKVELGELAESRVAGVLAGLVRLPINVLSILQARQLWHNETKIQCTARKMEELHSANDAGQITPDQKYTLQWLVLPLVVLLDLPPPVPVPVSLVDDLVLVAGDEADERVADEHERQRRVAEQGRLVLRLAAGETEVAHHAENIAYL